MRFQGTELLAESSRLPRWIVFPAGLLLVLGLGFVDYAAPEPMSFTLLYLLVCMVAGWAAGSTPAIALAVIAGLTMGWLEWLASTPDRVFAVWVWNLGCHLTVFACVGWLAAEATRLTRNSRHLVQQRTEQLEEEISQHKKSLSALQEAEQRFRFLVSNIPAVVWVSDEEGKTSYVSDKIKEVTGFEPQEIYANKDAAWFNRVHPADLAAVQSQYAALFLGVGFDVEYRFQRKDGHWIWLNDRSASFFLRDGRQHAYGVLIDVTGRKRHEFTLQIQRDVAARLSLTSTLETGLASLLELAVAIEGVDSGGIYLLDDKADVLRLHLHRGLGEEFVKAVSVFSMTSPQGLLVAAGQTVYLDRTMFDQGKLPTPEEEGLRALAAIPLRHEQRVLGCLNLSSHHHDSISEESRSLMELLGAQASGAIARIRAEQSLQASEARLRTIVTGAPVVLFAVDKNGTILLLEGKGLGAIGWKPGEKAGRNVREVFGDNPKLLSSIDRALKGEEFSTVESVGEATFETWYTPVREANGMASGYIGVATSITDRRRLERQLLDISEREQARIGQEVHDGLCQQLVSLAFDANALKTQLGGKNRPESAAVGRLVKYLDLSITEARRLARGLFPIRLETEGISPAIEELLLNTRDRFGLTCQFEAEPLIIANTNVATNLYRITQEALNNVVKHSRADRVKVTLRQRDGHVELRIEDNGIGIRKNRDGSHPGMGLHIMDYRTRNIGGIFQIENSPGGGTIISCLVPIPDLR